MANIARINELAKIAFSNGTDFAKIVTKTGKRQIYNDEGFVDGTEEYKYADVEFLRLSFHFFNITYTLILYLIE